MGKLKELAMDAIDSQETKQIAALLNDRFRGNIGINEIPTETLRRLAEAAEFEIVNRLSQQYRYIDEDIPY
jgi:hypothetical protein